MGEMLSTNKEYALLQYGDNAVTSISIYNSQSRGEI